MLRNFIFLTRKKRRTKATIAREAGLFPLARLILQNKPSLEVEAANFITEGFETADKTLAGACEFSLKLFRGQPAPLMGLQ